MGAFTAKYSDTQRAAIVAAILEDGMTAPEAVEAAALGDLSPDLGPFDMPVGTARHIAASERRRRGVLPTSRRRDECVDELFDETARLLVRVYVEEVRRSVRQAERGELDRENFRQLAKLGREMAGLVKALPQPDTTTAALVAEARDVIDEAAMSPVECAILEEHRRTYFPASDAV